MGMVVFFMMAIIFGIAILACLYEWLFGKNKNSNSLSTPVQNEDKKLRCSNCGGDNIQVSVSVVNQVIGSTREVREKDGITRTANHIWSWCNECNDFGNVVFNTKAVRLQRDRKCKVEKYTVQDGSLSNVRAFLESVT